MIEKEIKKILALGIVIVSVCLALIGSAFALYTLGAFSLFMTLVVVGSMTTMSVTYVIRCRVVLQEYKERVRFWREVERLPHEIKRSGK